MLRVPSPSVWLAESGRLLRHQNCTPPGRLRSASTILVEKDASWLSSSGKKCVRAEAVSECWLAIRLGFYNFPPRRRVAAQHIKLSCVLPASPELSYQ